MSVTIATAANYWISPNALSITRNALGEPNRIQASVAGGSVIICYIRGIKAADHEDPETAKNGDGLEYDNGHNYRRWPLIVSPTYFNSNTEKYLYVAIPRKASVGTDAMVVFPSVKLDIYGYSIKEAPVKDAEGRMHDKDGNVTDDPTKAVKEEQQDELIGSEDYFYIWLQGILSSSGDSGTTEREWLQKPESGTLNTDEAISSREEDWYRWDGLSQSVTFLKEIWMDAASIFRNLRAKILILNGHTLNGVAVKGVTPDDSNDMIVTPSYINGKYLRKDRDDSTPYTLGVGNLNVVGRVKTNDIQSHNYSGDSLADTGWSITNSYNGHSKLTIDEIYVRMKAVFESLEVRERTYTGGDQIWSCAGNYVNRTDYMGNDGTTHYVDENGVPYTDPVAEDDEAGQARARQRAQEITESTGVELYETPVAGETYGYSRIQIPWMLNGIALVLGVNNRLVRGLFAHYKSVKITLKRAASRGKGGTGGETDEQIIRKIRRVRCYFLAKDGERSVHNWWRINDLARCQTMNLENVNRETYLEETTTKVGNVFWWRKVIDVSYNPVKLEDGKWYHYFDVAFNSLIEESTDPAIHATMATFALEGSDIPAAADSVVQFGNTINPGRMNLMMMEVNGGDVTPGYAPSADAPCLKAYKGIYCFDLNKCWTGGKPCKMKLSPSNGYEFYGPSIKFVTEYDVVPVPIERPEIYWTNIGRNKDASGNWLNTWTFEGDAYPRAEVTPYSDDQKTGRNYAPYVDAQGHVRAGAPVRKCYYYEKVSHNGCYFICSIVDGAHWEAEETFVYGGRTYTIDQWMSDSDYGALPAEYQGKCKRVPNYTIEEPSATSQDWTMTVNSGAEPIAVYKWAQKESMTPQEKPTITAAQWAAWTNGSTPIDGWTKNAPNRPSTDPETWYLFQSQSKLYADGQIDVWSTPTRISGAQGTPGEDAEDTEWIYQVNNSKNSPADPNGIEWGTIPDPSNPRQRIRSKDKTKDDWVPDTWSDNALAIAWDNKYVWASFRTKARGANTDPSIQWGEWSTPIIWSHWGQNGMDGDGVEYVYIRTKNNVAPIVAYNDNINRSYSDGGKTITYLDDEFRPVISNNDPNKSDATKAWAESNTCTDDPSGISRDWPFEWCLSRTMTAPDAETGRRTWRCYGGEKAGDTETMALWDHYGENAIRLDIDNEMDSVQTDSLGKILSQREVSTVVRLWDGASEVDISTVDFTAQSRISGGPASTVATFSQAASGKGKQLKWTFKAGQSMPTAYEITISYVYLNVTHRCTFTITASMGQAVYQLKPSLSSLPCTVKSDNTYNNPPALPLSVVKIDGASTTEITELDNTTGGTIEGGEIFIRYSLDSMPTGKTAGREWPSAGSTKAFGTVQATSDKANVYIAMFNAFGTLLDRETIPIVKDGTNGDGIVSVVRSYAISNVATTASDTTEPAHQGSWSAGSPAVTEQYPYLWAKEVVTYKYAAATTKYYCIGTRGANGVDAQDIEWVYIRTKTNTAPVIKDDNTYTDTNGHNYTYDDHLPQVTGNANIENNNSRYQCTDDPKGVDGTWKYEWEIKREKGNADANGHRAWDYYQGKMTLHNNYAESNLIIDIDNDNDQFGVDADGKVLTQQACSTVVSMLYGTAEQAFSSVPTAVLKYNDGTTVANTVAEAAVAVVPNTDSKRYTVTVTIKATGSNTPVFGTTGKSGLYVDISGTCAKGGPLNIRFTMEKVMSGAKGENPEIYQLNPTLKNLSFSRNASNGLEPSSRRVTVNVLKTVGNTTTEHSSAISGVTYEWGFHSDSTGQDTTEATGKAVGSYFDVSNTNAASYSHVWIRLNTGDRETLPIVKDGANGADGKDGANGKDGTNGKDGKDGKDGTNGTNGTDGADAVSVVVTPSSVIVEQDLNNTGNINPGATNNLGAFTVQVMKGSVPCQIKNIALYSDSITEGGVIKYKVFFSNSDSSGYTGSTRYDVYATVFNLYIKGIGSSNSGFFDHGNITMSIVYYDGSTEKTISNIKASVYVNLVGTWSATTQNNITRLIGQKIGYENLAGEPDGVVKRDWQGDIQASATGLRSEYTEQIKRAGEYDCNLFGFYRGLEFSADRNTDAPVPWVQGYGVVFKGQQDASDGGGNGGRISNLGLGGIGGEFIVTCQMKLTSGSGGVMVELCDVVSTRGKGSVPSNSDYVTVGTSWQSYEFHITIPNTNTAINTLDGHLDFQGNWRNTNGPYIYVRHLNIQRGEKADFVEANEDIGTAGGLGNLITGLTAREGNEIPVPYDFTVETDVVKSGYYVSVNLNNWGSDETFRDYIWQNSAFLLKEGVVYTLSYWAKTDNAGMIITHHLYGPSIIQHVEWGAMYDDGGATVEEALSEDGHSMARLSTTWKKYYVRFYVTIPSSSLRSLIALRIDRGLNKPGSTYRSGTIYIAGIEFQEGYVMDYGTFKSLIKQDARRISMSQETGLKRAGIDIENGKITLDAENIVATGNFYVPRVISENDKMITTIEAGQLTIRSKVTASYGKFAINDIDEIVLQMFDKDGKMVLNLGGTPNRSIAAKWVDVSMRYLGTTIPANNVATLTANAPGSTVNPCIIRYHLTIGKELNGSEVMKYFYPDLQGGGEVLDDNQKALDDRYFTYNTMNAPISTGYLVPNGYYVMQNNGIFRTEPSLDGGDVYVCDIYKISSGLIARKMTVQLTG